MRFLAYFALALSLAAAAYAGQTLWQELQVSYDPVPTPAALAEAAEPQPPSSALPPRKWPLLFGEKQPPQPPKPEEAEAEPQPPAEKAPPIDALGYTLKGVVRDEGRVWAMVSHPTGDRVLRVGDELAAGMVVSKIDERGLWAAPDGGTPALLGFEKE